MTHIRFDEIDTYDVSDTDDEYTEKEKSLLKNVRAKRTTYSDSEEEVYDLEGSESDQSEIANSDIDGKDDDDLPDARAWGKNKRSFYSADYVDPDYGGYQGKDAMLADLEEGEAQNIQKRLAQQLDDDDFALEIFNKKSVGDVVEKEIEIIKSDLSSLPKRQLLELLRRESPELFQLLEDYKEKMKIVKEYMVPIVEMAGDGRIINCKALDFVKTYYHLLIGYCININMYILLKISEVNVANHPVIKRLVQYRKFITQMEPIYIEIIKPQLDTLISADYDPIVHQDPTKHILNQTTKKNSKRLKLLKKLDKKQTQEFTMEKPKCVSFALPEESNQLEPSVETTPNEDIDQNDLDESEENEAGVHSEGMKRAITYQMAKNKGLTPQRKKEQRNPRVKHRNKYKKAIIRRKGAMREVRKELSRYGGEISGIKASVTKSVKIK